MIKQAAISNFLIEGLAKKAPKNNMAINSKIFCFIKLVSAK